MTIERVSVLLVDDDEELCSLLARAMEREAIEMTAVHDAGSGLHRATTEPWSLVILDVMLPGGNGIETLAKIREKSKIPVIMLTARGEERYRIKGLEVGADDYVAKPFSPRELIARIRAILRRVPDQGVPDVFRVGDLHIDHNKRVVMQEGNPIELTSAEYEVLLVLVRAAGKTVSRDELAEKALGREVAFLDRSIDMHISNLRKKLGAKYGLAERIKSVRGAGYVYNAR
ncbi:two component transcriptional regulator, winged helix family [Candidatus Koribacter versatilis Ellin345]|uniref:Two component transcriptional regulator, winged helix family n=1 Tax=Koribacter versatilis (strain Ellin345) TaxID=204669 RepID=Q1IJV4_KORVE|nr:response regulator transcription factor [Candidatus Koribacter versatilis]ABF42846.1 two component transcriptional regulator, winged helix family [Candidatus Koribacter versatilis Ellin345]